MMIIAHRRNTVQELQNTPLHYGVEIDIRTIGEKFIIQHDPYVIGESLEQWLDAYNHKILILNVKDEGLEERLIALMREKNIVDYFFLDQSFPFLVKWSNLGEKRSAVRVSEFESIVTA